MSHSLNKPFLAITISFVLWCSVVISDAYAVQQVPPDSIQVQDESKRSSEEENWNRTVRQYSDVLDEDPENLEARYFRAIAYRELSKILTLRELISSVIRGRVALDKERARQDFEYILARDSLYREVLFQYAVLQRYHKAYPEAIALVKDQIRLKPEIAEAYIGLMSIFKHFFHYAGAEAASTFVEKDGSDYARFFEGELLRQGGHYHQARRLLEALLTSDLKMPAQPILLSLARIHYALDEHEAAQAYYNRAIESIRSSVEALFVFEDIKYIISDDELNRFRSLQTADEYQSFFLAFWSKRNPLPAQGFDVRMAEHYRRLLKAEEDYAYYGFRTWHNNPDPLTTFRFPEAFSLNDEFNDKGLIYIRHGEPSDWARVSGLDIETNESWRYLDPDMEFHFEMVAGGNNWRLVPTLQMHPEVLDSRAVWGGTYHVLARALSDRLSGGARAAMAASELVAAESILIDESRENVQMGFSTDRHTWERPLEHMNIPFTLATFRGENGEALLELYYALPIGHLSRQQDEVTFPFELGMAVHDTSWQTVGRLLETKQLPYTSDLTAAAFDFFYLTVPPDSYHVAFHGRLLESDLIGAFKTDIRVPDFSKLGLQTSDLLLAYDISATRTTSHYTKGGLYVTVNPTQRFDRNRTVFVYFEIYGLTLGADDLTRYTIEYTLVPEKPQRRILRLFRSNDNRPSLSLKTTSSGEELAPIEHAEIDASRVDPGLYSLTVTVTDEYIGTTATRSISVELE